MTQNPYKPTADRSSKVAVQPPSPRRWAAIGFLVICLPIASLGFYGLYADARYAATLPPNTPRCGNAAMGAFFLVFPIAPILGCIGAGVGYVSAIVRDAAAYDSVAQDPSERMADNNGIDTEPRTARSEADDRARRSDHR